MLEPFVAVTRDDREQLALPRSDRDAEPAAVAKLVAQGIGHGRRRRRDDDPVPRRTGWIALAAVRLADLDRSGQGLGDGVEARPRRGDQRGLSLERGDAGAQPGEDRGLVAGAGAVLEDAIARSHA